MEALIEIIVWLFRALFGDPERPADVNRGPRAGPPPQRRQRGPYAYGDEQQSGAARPKTLEEILEEVRLAAAQKQRESQSVSGPRPPARPAPPPRRAAPPPQRAARPSLATTEDLTASPPDTHVAPSPPAPPPHELAPAEFAPPAPRSAPQPPPIRRAAPYVPPVPAPAAAARTADLTLTPAAEAPAEESLSSNAAAAATAQAVVKAGTSTAAGMLVAIRTAQGSAKREMARQAIMLNEVFGPPRARRPYGKVRRMF